MTLQGQRGAHRARRDRGRSGAPRSPARHPTTLQMRHALIYFISRKPRLLDSGVGTDPLLLPPVGAAVRGSPRSERRGEGRARCERWRLPSSLSELPGDHPAAGDQFCQRSPPVPTPSPSILPSHAHAAQTSPPPRHQPARSPTSFQTTTKPPKWFCLEESL